MAYLSPPLKQKFTDANNEPLVGGKVYTYRAGTTTPRVTYSDQVGTENTNPIILDAKGEADIWLSATGNYKFVVTDANDVEISTIDDVKFPAGSGGGGGGGLPDGGLEGAVLTKISDDDQDADWELVQAVGYSQRYGTAVDIKGLQNLVNYIFNITYTGPAISLSASGSGTIREKGESVASTTLTASLTKRSNPLAEVRFYRNPSTLLNTQTSGGGIPNGGNSTYNYATAFSDNVTFRAEVDDVQVGLDGPTTASATASFTFVYPYYYGAGAPGLSAAAVAALTKDKIVSTSTVNRTIAAAGGNVLYFAYPASYGALTSILDVNNFETLPDWTLSIANITGLDGNAVSYRIYQFNNPLVAGSYYYSFRR